MEMNSKRREFSGDTKFGGRASVFSVPLETSVVFPLCSVCPAECLDFVVVVVFYVAFEVLGTPSSLISHITV